MISVSEAFEKFRKKLELSQTEQNDASKRQKEVRTCIGKSFDVEKDFLTGSYARHTKTKPLKDVDIFFVLGEEEEDRRKNTPSKMLDAFEDCLIDEYGVKNVERGRRCITVRFDKRNPTVAKDGKVLSIDAVPAFNYKGHYEIPDDILSEWIQTDPTVHQKKATENNKRHDDKWVPLVKMLKAWNREHGKPIKPSFLVEVMAIDLVDPPFNNYPHEIRAFFAAAMDEIENGWPDPAGHGPPVSDQMDTGRCEQAKKKLREAEVLAARADRAESQGKNGDALKIWREILGSYFPLS